MNYQTKYFGEQSKINTAHMCQNILVMNVSFNNQRYPLSKAKRNENPYP